MSQRSNVSPATLPVQTTDDGIEVEYLDGRRVAYRAPPQAATDSVSALHRSHVHILVVDEAAGHGRMVYVNDRDTEDEILEQSGVGRVMVGDGETAAIAQGVDVTRSGEEVRVAVDDPRPDRSVYVFVENQLEERAYRIASAE